MWMLPLYLHINKKSDYDEYEEIIEEMKERHREERGAVMKVKKQKK